jgi:hypothetical protein
MLSRHRRGIKKLNGAVELAGLSPRAVNALGRHGIRSRAAAFETDVLELLKGERNCGKKTLEDIRRWMDDAPCAGQEVPGSNGRLAGEFGSQSMASEASQ